IAPATPGSQDPDRGRLSVVVSPAASPIPDRIERRARIRRSGSRPTWIIAICALAVLLRLRPPANTPPAPAPLLALVLSGVVEALSRFRIPRAVSAAVLLLLVAAAVGGTVDRIATPAQQWLMSAPRILHTIELKIRPAQSVLRRVDYIARRATAL